MFNYLRTRLRSAAKTASYMKCSLNPDQDHHVFKWVEPYLDKDGYPDKNLCGKTRYFVYSSSVLYTSWDKEELLQQFPNKKPRTYTFIPSLLNDNPQLLENEPDYAESLDANGEKERMALLKGCWFFRPESGTYFNRNWCDFVNEMPRSATRVRSWDLASSEPTTEYPNPDWTASVRMARASDGYFYIETGKRFRKKPGSRDNEILKTSKTEDEEETIVTVPRDPGAGGKSVAEDLAKKILGIGYRCRQIPAGNQKNMKVKRFIPFSSAAENGLIKIVKSGWSQEELDKYLEELESFTGDDKGKDDYVDATADAYNELSRARHIPDFTPYQQTKINEFKR